MVLSRVQHLEQGRRRVAPPVASDLVDLVEHDHRVHRLGVAQGPHQAARQGADVGPAVAADLGLVAHASQGDAHELAAGGPGDGLADGRLAGAGRTDQGQDGARLAVGGVVDSPVAAQLHHADVLHDPVLDVVQARVVGVQHLTCLDRVQDLLGLLRPRDGDQPVQVGADHRALARLLAHALQPAQLLLGLLAHLVRHAGFLDLGAVLLRHRGVVLVQLLADRVHLLAQEVLALLLVGARLDVVADLLAHLQLGQALLLEVEGLLQALGHVQGLQQVDLVLVGDVRRVAGGVGQGARLGDRAQEGRDPAVVAAQLQELLHHGAVLTLEVAGLAVHGLVVRVRGDLHAQLAVGVGVRGPGDGAVQAAQRDRVAAPGQAHVLCHLGDRPHAGELVVLARDDQDPLLVADVDRQRDRHVGEDDGVVDRYQQKRFHQVNSLSPGTDLRKISTSVAASASV